jgi:hypothetical protein
MPLDGTDRLDRRDIVALAVLGLICVGIPLFLSAAAGVVGIPSNDDWVYMRAASSLYDSGAVNMSGHYSSFVAQLAMVQPLLWLSGGAPWAFTAFGLLMALVGVTSTYLLARRFIGTGSAVMVALLVVVFPGFARQSAGFMTDVPAFALIALCLLLGTRYLQGDGGRVTLLVALGVGVTAVGIREFALAAPAAILVAAWARSRPGERVWFAASCSFFAAGVLAVLAIASSAPGHAGAGSFELWRLIHIGPAFATLSVVLLPAVVLHITRRIANFSPDQIVLAAGLACLLVVLPNGPLVGNLWTQYGLGGNDLLIGYREPVFGFVPWALSSQLAIFAAILVAAIVLQWGQLARARVTTLPAARAWAMEIARSPVAPLALFLLAYAGGVVLYAFVGLIFDRYLYPLIPAAAILLLLGPRLPLRLGRNYAVAHSSFAALVIAAFIVAANSSAYDSARYREGEAAVAMGYDATTVDAGYEWVGAHAVGPQKATLDPKSLTPWDGLFMSGPPCAVLSNSELDLEGYRLIRVNPSAYRQFLFFGTDEPLYLYGAMLDGCPAPPPAVSASTTQ